MLTTLTSIKLRLGLNEADHQFDSILTNAIKGVSAQFENECGRRFARGTGIADEFNAAETELCLYCYPVEWVSRFELKTSESGGWSEQLNVEFLVRAGCIISLSQPIGFPAQQARVIYTGGYVLPGDVPAAGQVALPDDLEQAAVEQIAGWFQNRDKVGLLRNWPSGGVFQQFMSTPLLPNVSEILRSYQRWAL